MKAFITGIAGFAGSHLAEFLLAQSKVEVSGLVHERAENVNHLQDKVVLYKGNLLEPESILAALSEVQPYYVYHLAGQANVFSSWKKPWETFEANVRGQLNLLEAVRETAPSARVLIVGSNEEYGRVSPDCLPVDENTPLRPDSPYGVSKVAQDLLGLQYHLSYGLNIIRTRPFNHIGPRQSDRFVAANFARQVAEIEAGIQEAVIRVGNLKACRDFTDVRDTVRAYALLLEHAEPGEVYNVGSGEAHAVQEVLDTLIRMAKVEVRVEVDPERLRPSDSPVICCDYTRLYECTHWRPSISLTDGLRDTLDYWRMRVGEVVKRQT